MVLCCSLSDNFTGDDGCVAFTKTLKVNKTLLYLSYVDRFRTGIFARV